jgi:uncharacterized protein
VNDYAGLLSPAERDRLEARLAEGERKTGAQVVVAIFRALEGESLEDYSIRLAEQWRIGHKGLDNGVIVLVFLQERRVRMEVGYGLEGVIPDAVAGTLIRETLAPQFRAERYAAGIEAVSDALYARIAGEAPPPGARGRPSTGARPLPLSTVLLLVLIVGVIGVSVLSALRNSSRRSYTAGGRRGWHGPPPIFYGGGRGGGWSRGGGGFSGGGGGFGGGGASGSW